MSTGARRTDIATLAMDLSTKIVSIPQFEAYMGPFSAIMMDYGDVLNALKTLVDEMCRIDDSGCEVWEHVKAEVIPNSVPPAVRMLIGLDW